MSIIIKTERVVFKNGVLGRKILGWDALKREILPAKYLIQENVLYKNSNEVLFLRRWGDIRIGDMMSEQSFSKLLDLIRLAGETLSRINKEHREKRASWNGEETFVI